MKNSELVRKLNRNAVLTTIPETSTELFAAIALQGPMVSGMMVNMPEDPPKEYLTTAQVCALFNVSTKTVMAWAKKGRLKRYKGHSNIAFYKKSELPSWEEYKAIRLS